MQGNVAAHPLVRHLGAQHGAVHMGAVEVALAAVAVEQQVEDFLGQRGGKNSGSRCSAASTRAPGCCVWALSCASCSLRLCASACTLRCCVRPPRGIVAEQAAGGGDLLGGENVLRCRTWWMQRGRA